MNKFFVEIGSSDFDTLLPLAELGWSGIIVEPLSECLNNLERYDSVIYENVAIHSYNGETEFIYYDSSLMDDCGESKTWWTRGLGTTNLDMNHMINNPQWKKYERQITVDCLTLDSLLEKYEISEIDFMKVDVEGEECKIFVDYSWRVKPDVIKIESEHWNKMEKLTMKTMLIENGYLIWEESNDWYSVR